MNKKEALIARINGEKVKVRAWPNGHYLYYDEGFRYVSLTKVYDYNSEETMTCLTADNNLEWEIVVEKFSFAEAFEMYEKGIAIKSLVTDAVFQKDYEREYIQKMYFDEIRGKFVKV